MLLLNKHFVIQIPGDPHAMFQTVCCQKLLDFFLNNMETKVIGHFLVLYDLKTMWLQLNVVDWAHSSS